MPIGLILWLTITDYRPRDCGNSEIRNLSSTLSSERISIFNWNLGYGGLGQDMDFFMDGGSRIKASKSEYETYWNGIQNTVKNHENEIYFFQEIDRSSTRSYKEDQYDTIFRLLGDYSSSFSTNYKVGFIPSPQIIGSPYGSIHSGLAIYSRFHLDKSERISLPGNYSWPKKIFFLDRCMLVSRITSSEGKTIVLINTHNSAYDKGGFLKKEQLEFIRDYAEKEYAKGNHIVIGGDWNSYLPGSDGNSFPSEEKIPDFYQPLPADWEMENWKWAVDLKTATNRSLENPYIQGKTFTSLIDGFLLSPNIDLLKVQTINMEFKYSDHNPIELEIELK